MTEPNLPEGEKIDALVTFIEAYEAKYYSMNLPSRVAAIKLEFERKRLTVKALELLTGKSRRCAVY